MGGMDDNIGNKRNERGEKGAKQEHTSEGKGTVESLNMKNIKMKEVLFLNNKPDALIIPNLSCYKTYFGHLL